MYDVCSLLCRIEAERLAKIAEEERKQREEEERLRQIEVRSALGYNTIFII